MRYITILVFLALVFACKQKKSNDSKDINDKNFISEEKAIQFTDSKINSFNRGKFLAKHFIDTSFENVGLFKKADQNAQKEKILKKIKSPYFFESHYATTDSTWLDKYLSKCYLIDLNFDNQLDFIYNGASGADAVSIEIYLKKDENYECVYNGLGEIVDISKNDDTYFISIDNYYTHGFFIEKFMKFSVNKSGFKLKESNKNFYGTFFPESTKFQTKFELQHDDTVRFNPQRLNEPCIPYSEVGDEYCGNIFRIVEKGKKAIVYSTYNDDSWWFIKI